MALASYGPGVTVEDLRGDVSAEQIAELVLRHEGLNPEMHRQQYEWIIDAANDWLFDPHGRGARSGLPD